MNLNNTDRALVQGQSSIGFGTIIKGWRDSKGLDYIIIGINTNRKELYAVKHNCINRDGSIHASVTRHKRVFKYTTTPSGQVGIVKGITSVLGQKRSLDAAKISQFNLNVDNSVGVIPFSTINFFTPAIADRRQTTVYN